MGVWLSLLSLHACPKAPVAKTAELPHAILKFGEADCYPLQLYRACFGMTFVVWFKLQVSSLFPCGFDEGIDLYGHLPGIIDVSSWINIPIKTPAGHATGSWPFMLRICPSDSSPSWMQAAFHCQYFARILSTSWKHVQLKIEDWSI